MLTEPLPKAFGDCLNKNLVILGAGATGLAAGFTSGARILEARQNPGGICSSYYLGPDSVQPTSVRANSEEDYRFEIGGGHWIFGGDPAVLEFINGLVPLNHYTRKSGVFFPKQKWRIPFPIQNNLGYFPGDIADKALSEILNARPGKAQTLEEWLLATFGKTLFGLFFSPFHELYTAGLYKTVAPQDDYKSPIDLHQVKEGRHRKGPAVGYNATFAYPQKGLGELFALISEKCRTEFVCKVVKIDIEKKLLLLDDGRKEAYEAIISTLPLNKMLSLTGIEVDSPTDPYTSVLVINIGATKGRQFPREHWLYIPESTNKFHRVGFYSNVDESFLPRSSRDDASRVSLYVEKAFPGGCEPKQHEKESMGRSIADELIDWGFIAKPEIIHSTWVDVAYTWAYPQSTWRAKALVALERKQIFQAGRYGRWIFQGIADSIKDGFAVGSALKEFVNK